jgi:selenocysteine lyase/cysteine desulfurase
MTATSLRSEFSALADGWAALDGAAGTAVPDAVVAAVSGALGDAMANLGGAFEASARSTAVVAGARAALADLVGGDAAGVVLGPNMTTLTFHIAETLAAGWSPGDEVVVT